jgi:hypothetical protein
MLDLSLFYIDTADRTIAYRYLIRSIEKCLLDEIWMIILINVYIGPCQVERAKTMQDIAKKRPVSYSVIVGTVEGSLDVPSPL